MFTGTGQLRPVEDVLGGGACRVVGQVDGDPRDIHLVTTVSRCGKQEVRTDLYRYWLEVVDLHRREAVSHWYRGVSPGGQRCRHYWEEVRLLRPWRRPGRGAGRRVPWWSLWCASQWRLGRVHGTGGSCSRRPSPSTVSRTSSVCPVSGRRRRPTPAPSAPGHSR